MRLCDITETNYEQPEKKAGDLFRVTGQVGGTVPAHELLSAADKLVDLFNEKMNDTLMRSTQGRHEMSGRSTR